MRWYRNERSIRRILFGGAFAATLAVGVLLGTLITSHQAQAQPSVTFSGSAALMFHFIKPSATADYEGSIQKLKDALAQSENTETDRQAAAAARLFSQAEQLPPGEGPGGALELYRRALELWQSAGDVFWQAEAWDRIVRLLPPAKLEAMIDEATLDDLPILAGVMLEGRVSGRIVVDVNA